ncbi:MAG: hypothetical protein GF320_00190 [Armatimonadia bacterium]|nr:hypothetical protein [Armatimonadia bacterium]
MKSAALVTAAVLLASWHWGCAGGMADDLIRQPELSRTALPFSGGAVRVSVELGPGMSSQGRVVAVVTYPDGSLRERLLSISDRNPTILEVTIELPPNEPGSSEEQRYHISVRATDGMLDQSVEVGTVVVTGAAPPPDPPFDAGGAKG